MPYASMKDYTHKSMDLRLIKKPQTTIFLETLEEKNALRMFEGGVVYNKQELGYLMKDFKKSSLLKSKF